MSTPAQKPSLGRVVRFVLHVEPAKAPFDAEPVKTIRCATVVRVWDDGVVNLNVLTDGSNDHQYITDGDPQLGHAQREGAPLMNLWRTSVHYDEAGAAGTWHWPPRD